MADQGEHTFALCLSHDVDRVYKTHQYFYNAVTEGDVDGLKGLFESKNPYWQFERFMAIESEYDVRSSFNVLDEIPLSDRPISEWVSKQGWMLYAGRYDIMDKQIASTLKMLNNLDWEIGLHGSYTSSENPNRFKYEKERIESVVNTEIIGNRQHHWRLSPPETWEHLQEAGIKYDTSLGHSTKIDPQHGHELIRPFDDEFVVFPWSLMDHAVMDSAETTEDVWSNCERVLEDAKENQSVIVADWHSNVLFEPEYPDYALIYERLIERALDMGAWVGPPGQFYDAIPHPDGTVENALENLADHKKPVYA